MLPLNSKAALRCPALAQLYVLTKPNINIPPELSPPRTEEYFNKLLDEIRGESGAYKYELWRRAPNKAWIPNKK